MREDSDWADLVSAEQDYVEARRRLFSGDPTAVLRRGLSRVAPSADDRRLAVRVLEEVGGTRPDVVRSLIPELFELALGMHAMSARIRRIVIRLDPDVLQASIAPLVGTFLRQKQRDAQEYWGIIVLLKEAKLADLLTEVLAEAAASSEENIRRVAQSWVADMERET